MTTAIANVTDVTFSGNLRIDWTGTGDTYHVRTRPTDGAWSAELLTSDDTGIDISGLTAGAHYDIEIVTEVYGAPPKIPGGLTVPDYYGYVVPSDVEPPGNVKITAQTPTTVTLTWDKNTATPSDAVFWVDDLGNTEAITDIADNTIKIDNLDPNRFYKFYVGSVQNEEIIWNTNYVEKEPACCDPQPN